MSAVISIKNVTKRFREVTALDNVSVDFEAGKIHGVIGRNGSGKSVLFKCITGFMRPDSGEIFVNGAPVKPLRPAEIGIIIEHPGFISNLSGYTNLRYLAGIRRKISKEKIRETLRFVGLDPEEKKSRSEIFNGYAPAPWHSPGHNGGSAHTDNRRAHERP